ncbi:MAG: FAD-binding oxidoreductase [Chloroflexales bacterium]|nr:FAD-binding oxidoreductase [Chloroflexales bacterium]
MKRWNGWGDDAIDYPLPEQAKRLLEQAVGAGSAPRDATLEELVATVPSSRLPAHPLISQDPIARARHSRGQSLPDWIALRSAQVDMFPDGVASPTSNDDIRSLLNFARSAGARLIPYGGGTSVVGHINSAHGDAPVITVDMGRMRALLRFDATSQLATFGAGITGPDLEAHVRASGYTLGHFPQSFEYSTLGGWIATRSSGQQSLGYGRIEQLFAGGRLEAPAGTLVLPAFSASAAGPDLREMILGSEGRMGILTEATVRVTALPKREEVHTVFFPDWEQALLAARQIIQSQAPLSLLRLSTPVETATTLAMAGHTRAIGALERLLALRGVGNDKCILMMGCTGTTALVTMVRKAALQIATQHGGVHVGRAIGRQWLKNRFRTPYLRNSLWESGYALDTLETASNWADVPALLAAIEESLRNGLADCGERVFVFSHLSHLYPTGSSIYTTYLYRIAPDPQETLRRWNKLKAAASLAIIARGGTISHQHGVGVDHRPYLPAEKGKLGMNAIQTLCANFDPDGLMNPGKLYQR